MIPHFSYAHTYTLTVKHGLSTIKYANFRFVSLYFMTTSEIFNLGIAQAVRADPRGPEGVEKYLKRIAKEYADLKPQDKDFFDLTLLKNPYPDSSIHYDNGKSIRRVMVGIDISGTEILLASQLGERDQAIDLVIGHHPNGKSLANLQEVMEMSVGVYESYGLPIHIAEKLIEERIREVGRSTHPANHDRVVDVARLLDINFIDTHTITDNLVDKFLRDLIEEKKPETLGDTLKILMEIPEYQLAKRQGAGPKIIAGSSRHRLGKCVVEMTGGTNPSAKVYPEFSKAGFSTMLSMHMREDGVTKANECSMNVIITGHMASDSLGMNLFLDELEKKSIEIVVCGGLMRVSRLQKIEKKKTAKK